MLWRPSTVSGILCTMLPMTWGTFRWFPWQTSCTDLVNMIQQSMEQSSSLCDVTLGLYNDAIIAANMALEISPSFVVSHFTLANIYTSKKDLEKAKLFYVVSKDLWIYTRDNSLPSISPPWHSNPLLSPPWKGWHHSFVDRSSSEKK